MRRAILCVFIALIIQKEGATDSDFRPIPIPLDQWHYEKREARVGTLHETIKTEKPTTVAAVPAHYWEDALRHSVYLTLVRDKIDQLIAKGIVVSPNNKPDPHVSKEVDDHDLWEKIKQAPFDRVEEGDHSTLGDVTIMAKGRLLEENGGFRFTEDTRSKEDCKEDGCMEGVKAFWSVKRVRQRDDEISPGKYHYELTFSVNSQPPKKQRKPHETPVRTFTVRENPPDAVATPQENPYYQTPRPQPHRPQRAVWFHRNIVIPAHHNQARYHNQGLDRIFSSIFSDDDTHVEPAPRYKPNPYIPPMYPQYSKLGYVGLPSDQHQHKRIMQYPYKPNIYKYPRPPLQAPPLNHAQHHYVDMEAMSHNPYGPPSPDHRYLSPSNIVKTTRPAVLPTPPVPSENTTANDVSSGFNNDNQINVTENVTSQPELPPIYKTFNNRPRPPPSKISYYPERLRPPIYNAPPGVFLTMEKKPFKPMPPLKYNIHGSKPAKRPIDFRPSPQVLDGQFSDPDTTVESAFRPIRMNFTDTDDEEKTDSSQHNKQSNKHVRKPAVKKPPKKHENIKSHRSTTTAPDIITVHSDLEDDNDTMQWANILGAFTKTMEPQKDTEKVYESTTEPMAPSSTLPLRRTTENFREMTTTSTAAPLAYKKRTRPPHKFVKPEKVKKHKRITTTTKAPEKIQIKKTPDLTPQASSAATGGNKPWQPKNKTVSTITTTSSSTTNTTTQKPLISTTPVASTSTATLLSTTIETETITKPTELPTELKNKNRFRQSTLMYKGTSVKHDRWSVNASAEKKVTATTTGKYPPRRKGSNFQGYGATTASKYSSQEQYREYAKQYSKKTDSSPAVDTVYSPQSTQPSYEETADHYSSSKSTEGYSKNEEEYEDDHDDIEVKVKNDDDQESEDHAEFIFDLTSRAPNEKSNEINEDDLIVTEQSIVATSHSVSKNRTKCKKKKHQHLTPTQLSVTEEEYPSTTSTTTTMASTTKSSSGLDILDELLSSLTYNESTAKPEETKPSELDKEESENHEKYLQIDEDFEDFLDNLGNRKRHSDDKDDVEYEDDDKEPSFDDDDSPFDNDDVNEPSTNTSDKDYDDYHERSYSLLELMAME